MKCVYWNAIETLLVCVFICQFTVEVASLHQKDKTTSNNTENTTPLNKFDVIDNFSEPVLVPIREVITGPHPLGKKQWHWYRWTRSKYHSHKHHQKKSNSATNTTLDRIYENATNCDTFVESSLDDFPDDWFTQDQRQNGAIVFHFLAAIYFFTISGVVIDRYFIPSVHCICEDLGITPDVGAAIFMATATATPELFTNLISTFITDSDMGIGTVIGSLMFNILGVTSLSVLLIIMPVKIDWWPLTRDCSMFAFNVAFLLIFAWDGRIYLWEASVLLILIILYYVVMFNSHRLGLFMKRKLNERNLSHNNSDLTCNEIVTNEKDVEKSEACDCVYTISPTSRYGDVNNEKLPTNSPQGCKVHTNNTSNTLYQSNVSDIPDEKKDSPVSLWSIPDKSLWLQLWWYYSWPICFILAITLPNPNTCRRFYVLTFIICIIWIGFVAYLIFWMLVVIGATFYVPESVLGLTVLAIGGCTPEMITGVIMARRGQAGTGIANSLGASSLAILLSLGLPWFIKILLKLGQTDRAYVLVAQDSTVVFTIASLLFVPVALFVIISSFKFILRRIASIFLFFSYFVFVTFAVLIELDVIFPFSDSC